MLAKKIVDLLTLTLGWVKMSITNSSKHVNGDKKAMIKSALNMHFKPLYLHWLQILMLIGHQVAPLKFQITSSGGTTCIGWKFVQQMVPIVFILNLATIS